MKILIQALNKIKSINKPQRDFFVILVQGLIGITGKKTFRNLSRYMQIAEHTFSRHMKKTLDFISLNLEMIKSIKKDGDDRIAAQDASFISKSGKKTHGLGFFWNGSAGKAERGIEVDVIAIVKVNGKKDAYTISAQQTPAKSSDKSERKKNTANDESKIDFYVNHLKKTAKALAELGIKHMVADAFMAKIKYVNNVVNLGFHVISKLRKDARFRTIYTGEQKSRGRRKKFETGKVIHNDFENSTITNIDDEKIELRSRIVYSVSLKREIKVILIRKCLNSNKYGEALLFSTDLKLDNLKIYEYYVSRFQIEFIFRDAKGFTGLDDSQSRDSDRMNYHFNASLTALNVARIQDYELQQKLKTKNPFSMANWTRKYHVDIILNRIISMFGFDLTLIKLHPDYENIISFANIKH